MSVDAMIYLGPYFECTYRPATRKDSVWGCSNPSCERHPTVAHRFYAPAGNAFCAVCGTKNSHISVETEDRPDIVDVLPNEALLSLAGNGAEDEVLRLAPNVKRRGEKRHAIEEPSGRVHEDLTSADMVAEMQWLREAFAPEMKKLLKAYSTVTIKWGLHVYYL